MGFWLLLSLIPISLKGVPGRPCYSMPTIKVLGLSCARQITYAYQCTHGAGIIMTICSSLWGITGFTLQHLDFKQNFSRNTRRWFWSIKGSHKKDWGKWD